MNIELYETLICSYVYVAMYHSQPLDISNTPFNMDPYPMQKLQLGVRGGSRIFLMEVSE